MGHIINLSAQSFLYVTDKEAVDEAQMIEGVSTTLAEVSEWRKKGCLGQLRGVVVHFQLSSIRMHRFLQLSRNKALARDNATRWSSWYNMIRVATSTPCKQAILEYFKLYPEECPEDQLTEAQWLELESICVAILRLPSKVVGNHAGT